MGLGMDACMVAVAQLATSDIRRTTDNPWRLNYAFNHMIASDIKHTINGARALHVSASKHQMLLVAI